MSTNSDGAAYPRRAKRIIEYRGGLEEKIETLGWVLVVTSMFLAIGHGLVTLFIYAITMQGVTLFGLIGTIAILGAGIVTWVLFMTMAEFLRIQKKANGLPYSGLISAAYGFERFSKVCGKCDAMLHSEMQCDQCGCRLDRDEIVE